MKKEIWIGLLLVALTALGIVVVRQNGEINRLKETPPVVTVVTQKVTVVAPPARIREAAPAPAVGTPKADVAPAPRQNALGALAGATNFMSGIAQMMKDPQFKEGMRAQMKMGLDKMYAGYFKKVKLSTDEMDALKTLLAERQMALTDLGLGMMSGGTLSKQAADDIKTSKEDYDAKIKDLLSPQDYQTFQHFEETQGERMQVEMFKGNLGSADGLTDQQQEDLVAAFFEERQTMPTLSRVNNQTPDPSLFTEERIADMLQEGEQLRQRYSERAAAVLTPVQLEQYNKFQAQWASMQTMGLKMAAKMFAPKPATMPAAP